MRILRNGILVLLALCGSASAQVDGPALYAQKDREMLRPTVRIDADEGPGTGTIIFAHKREEAIRCANVPRNGARACVSGVLLLSNHHVVKEHIVARSKKSKPKGGGAQDSSSRTGKAGSEGVTPVTVTLYDYPGPYSQDLRALEFLAEIVAWDEKRDLALLHIADVAQHLAAVASLASAQDKPRRHAPAWRAGCSGGYEPTIKFGTFQSVDLRPDQPAPLIAVVPIARGDSGGGVYHLNAQGRFEMIGVSEGSAEEFKNVPIEFLAFSITMENVHAFLKESGFGFVSEWHAASE